VTQRWVTLDGNEAASSVAYRLSEVIAISPATFASPMGEVCDAWAAERTPNLWGTVPRVVALQSEAGAAGAVHGALQAGALATTFTASQGLLLMLPNMFRIAGELTPAVVHVAARAVATPPSAVFGDHSDVMAARSAGWAMLSAGTVQEAHDFALLSHAASLETRIPFVHFFDGFRTSHEISRVARISDEVLRALIDENTVAAHRARALTPDHPVLRAASQNPDVFFQGREAANPFYEACPARVLRAMDRFARFTGRRYGLFDYVGSADADRVIVMMGSGACAAAETVAILRAKRQRVGLLKVRLFRPFSAAHLLAALPRTVRAIAVMDRTKESGAAGEPLYQDVVTAVADARASGESPFEWTPRVIGGRYGLGSKEFTPAMAEAVFHELTCADPTPRFTVGIQDDVSFRSLPYDDTFSTEADDVVRAVFYGSASDDTAGAIRKTMTIIADATKGFAQAYLVHDSQLPGSITASHLRFGPRPIESTYLIHRAQFVVCAQWELLHRIDILERAARGATVLLNVPFEAADVWTRLPARVRERIQAGRLKLYAIDAAAVAATCGPGCDLNAVLGTCFFALSNLLPGHGAVRAIKDATVANSGSLDEADVRRRQEWVDSALAHLHAVESRELMPAEAFGTGDSPVPSDAPRLMRDTVGPVLRGEGDEISVSRVPADGTFPVGTSKWEKRNLADEIPVWNEQICIQCGKCAIVCPHATIRIKVFAPGAAAGAPPTFRSTEYRGDEYAGMRYSIQVAPEDCTGCGLCIEVCPARDEASGVLALEMQPQPPLRDTERENFAFFLDLPDIERSTVLTSSVKGTQFLQPLFEFPGACAGCGVTPYLKLVSQLFGDRMVVANATGCSSIFGGSLATTPWTCNSEGRGPAWTHALVGDNAEFGYGVRLAIDTRAADARELLGRLRDVAGEALTDGLLSARQATEADIYDQRQRVERLREHLERFTADTDLRDVRDRDARRLLAGADYLVKKSVWLVGGDEWACDSADGGLDHVLASGANVNVLVLDTRTYSSTGAESAKAARRTGAMGLSRPATSLARKDVGLLALEHRNAYVAHVALGADDTQTVKALLEAESYDGPSLVIAYAHCTGRDVEANHGLEHQRRAVASGAWPLFRYDPRRVRAGERPFTLDSRPPATAPAAHAAADTRVRPPGGDFAPLSAARNDIAARWRIYSALAGQ
jgi:pyruvate-ferredoxin/flavodoxin oxidoreductase